jgi:hypothetical protein
MYIGAALALSGAALFYESPTLGAFTALFVLATVQPGLIGNTPNRDDG